MIHDKPFKSTGPISEAVQDSLYPEDPETSIPVPPEPHHKKKYNKWGDEIDEE